jgi:hypothetical protein
MVCYFGRRLLLLAFYVANQGPYRSGKGLYSRHPACWAMNLWRNAVDKDPNEYKQINTCMHISCVCILLLVFFSYQILLLLLLGAIRKFRYLLVSCPIAGLVSSLTLTIKVYKLFIICITPTCLHKSAFYIVKSSYTEPRKSANGAIVQCKMSEGARSLSCLLKGICSFGVAWGTFAEKPLIESIITDDLKCWRLKLAAASKSVNWVEPSRVSSQTLK